MDKHSKCSLYRLRMALAISIAFCFTTDIFAQATSTTDSTAIATPDTVGELTNGLNTVWMLLAAMLVFFMQPGFALVEAGFTRVKNTANILMKNFVDFMFGVLRRRRASHGRFPGIPDCILRNGCHHRVRSYGRTYQILHVPGLHHLHQCADLSRFRSLDLGRRLADER